MEEGVEGIYARRLAAPSSCLLATEHRPKQLPLGSWPPPQGGGSWLPQAAPPWTAATALSRWPLGRPKEVPFGTPKVAIRQLSNHCLTSVSIHLLVLS